MELENSNNDLEGALQIFLLFHIFPAILMNSAFFLSLPGHDTVATKISALCRPLDDPAFTERCGNAIHYIQQVQSIIYTFIIYSILHTAEMPSITYHSLPMALHTIPSSGVSLKELTKWAERHDSATLCSLAYRVWNFVIKNGAGVSRAVLAHRESELRQHARRKFCQMIRNYLTS